MMFSKPKSPSKRPLLPPTCLMLAPEVKLSTTVKGEAPLSFSERGFQTPVASERSAAFRQPKLPPKLAMKQKRCLDNVSSFYSEENFTTPKRTCIDNGERNALNVPLMPDSLESPAPLTSAFSSPATTTHESKFRQRPTYRLAMRKRSSCVPFGNSPVAPKSSIYLASRTHFSSPHEATSPSSVAAGESRLPTTKLVCPLPRPPRLMLPEIPNAKEHHHRPTLHPRKSRRTLASSSLFSQQSLL